MRSYEFSRSKYGPRLLSDAIPFETTWGMVGQEPYQLLYHEALFVTGGTATVELDDERFELRERWVCHSAPGTVRRVATQRAFKAMVLLVDPDFATEFLADADAIARLAVLSDGVPRAAPLPRARFERLLSGVRDLEREIQQLRPDSAPVLHAATYSAVLGLARELTQGAQAGGATHARRTLVSRFQSMVARDFTVRHRVDDYCRELGTTRKTLAAACRSELQASPHEVIRRRVLLEARRLLTFSDLSIGQVAARVGFADSAHFTRVFRAAERLTPRTFRSDR